MLARAQVLVENGIIFGDECSNFELKAELQALLVRCQNTMALCSCDLVSAILTADRRKVHAPAILTAAIKLVLESTPKALGDATHPWTPLATGQPAAVAAPSACFEAFAEGHLYHINVLTGTVLVDGSPLRRLGEDITQHALYRYVLYTMFSLCNRNSVKRQ
jgi:hypothetical protein